jgi:glycerol-3-phosphate cytidylyltransferase-like family protein
VGVTVDELVSYKNAEAIVPFEERIEIVNNIKCVDLAIPQDDLDKFVMWKKLKFDVMFIGDDWFDTERFKKYENDLARVGVEIIYLPYTKGVSTSSRKQKRIELLGN